MPSTATSVEYSLREQGAFQLIRTIQVYMVLTEKQVNNFANIAEFCILCPKCLQFPGLTRGKKGNQKIPGFLRLASGSCSIWIPFPVQPVLSADGYTHTCSFHALAPLRSNKIPPLQPPDQILNCSACSGWFTAGKDSTSQPETKGERVSHYDLICN